LLSIIDDIKVEIVGDLIDLCQEHILYECLSVELMADLKFTMLHNLAVAHSLSAFIQTAQKSASFHGGQFGSADNRTTIQTL